MLKKLDGMKLKNRLIYGFLTMVVMMIISGIFSIIGLGTLYASMSNYVNGAQKADTAVKMCRIEVNIAARNIREMALDKNEENRETYKQKVEENINAIGQQLVVLKESGILEDELYTSYETLLGNWEVIGYAIIDEIEAGNDEAATQKILNECAPALQEVIELSKEIDGITNAKKESAIKLSMGTAVVCVGAIIIFIVVACLLALKLSKQIINSILEPLHEIEVVAGELTAGNLHSHLEYHSDDEVGHLAHDIRKAMRILGSYVDDISMSMEHFSAGDFSVVPTVEWKGDFIGIYEAVKNFEISMADTVKGIQGVANQVSNGASQVAASATDLAEGAGEQAGITEELTATIESVTSQVAQNAEHAKEISKKVENVGDEIVNSNQKMQEMVNSMSEINNASQQISQIIATINEIASQTNLLALNASIEAARAGEAGKGFAVVADQVSLLAAQSADAAKESTALIQASVEAVEKGMLIAEDTAKQLENVLEGSRVITEEVNGVAMVLEEQAESMNQINIGVDQINEVVQTNSATSEECAAASQEMSSQAENLEDLISKFQIRG